METANCSFLGTTKNLSLTIKGRQNLLTFTFTITNKGGLSVTQTAVA